MDRKLVGAFLHFAGQHMAFQRDDLSVASEYPHVDGRLFVPDVGIPFAEMLGIILPQTGIELFFFQKSHWLFLSGVFPCVRFL